MHRSPTYHRLLSLLAAGRTGFRLIAHPPEGRTAEASLLRGHPVRQAAKCLVVRVALGRRRRRYVLAVVPGDRRVDLERLCRLYAGTEASFAVREVAERLAGCVSGSITPFTFSEELELVVDPGLLEQEEIYFNAARLDRSVALATDTYRTLARPRVESIANTHGSAPAAGDMRTPQALLLAREGLR